MEINGFELVTVADLRLQDDQGWGFNVAGCGALGSLDNES